MRPWVRKKLNPESLKRYSVIEFIEFVGLVEVIEFVRISLANKLWMSMAFMEFVLSRLFQLL